MSETAERKGDSKTGSTFIFQHGRCYNTFMPHNEDKQRPQKFEKKKKTNKQNREGRHDKREMKKRKRDFVEVMEAAPSNGCLYSTKFGVDLSHSFSLSLRR